VTGKTSISWQGSGTPHVSALGGDANYQDMETVQFVRCLRGGCWVGKIVKNAGNLYVVEHYIRQLVDGAGGSVRGTIAGLSGG
jgi:hypothetical protein